MRGAWWRAAVVTAGVVCVSCSRGERPVTVHPGEGAPQELAASLDARVRGDTVVFTLHLSNPTTGPVRLQFSSGQRFDFVVGSVSGEALWRWSEGRMFTQALETVTLAAGETVDFQAVWTGARAGEYSVTGVVTSSDKPVELRTMFEVPTR